MGVLFCITTMIALLLVLIYVTLNVELLIGLGLLVFVIILLLIGLIYLWQIIESLEEEQENLEQDFSLESKKRAHFQLQAKNLNNTLLKANQEIQRLSTECVNAEKSIQILSLKKIEGEKKIEQLSANCLEHKKTIKNLDSELKAEQSKIQTMHRNNLEHKKTIKNLDLELKAEQSKIQTMYRNNLEYKKTIKNLDSELKVEQFKIQTIYRKNTRTDILTTKIKHHRKTLMSELKNTLKDDIEIKLLPDYQYQIVCKNIEEPLYNLKELLSSLKDESNAEDNELGSIIFNPINKDIDKIIQHANENYGNYCGIDNDKYKEKLDSFINDINTV